MGPERATHRHKSSGPTSVISDYTREYWAQQKRSGYACTILLMHPKPSSWSDQRVPPHHLPSVSVPLISHLSHMLVPSCSVLLTANSLLPPFPFQPSGLLPFPDSPLELLPLCQWPVGCSTALPSPEFTAGNFHSLVSSNCGRHPPG